MDIEKVKRIIYSTPRGSHMAIEEARRYLNGRTEDLPFEDMRFRGIPIVSFSWKELLQIIALQIERQTAERMEDIEVSV